MDELNRAMDWFLSLSTVHMTAFIVYAAVGYGCLVQILTWTFLWMEYEFRLWRVEEAIRKDREMNARVKKMMSDARKRRAPSSIGSEQLALNQQVPGSSPGGLTTINEGKDVKRRITWYLEERTAIAMSDGDVLPTKFQWRDLPRPWEEVPGKPQSRQTRDFLPGEYKVHLLWDGLQTDKFLNEVVLKQFVIRMVYNIPNGVLVPSELLADANLVYKDDWVDQWGCTDKNEDIIECPRELYRPANRNIQIMRGNFLPKSGPQFNRHGPQNAKPRIHAKIDRREIPAVVEIPDEKCYFSFRAGGFYEKDQKPVEDACEKGEKAV